MPGTAWGKAAGGWIVRRVILIALILAACSAPNTTTTSEVRATEVGTIVLVLLLLGVGGYRLRVGRMAARTRELEQLVAERTEALAQRTSETARRQRELEALYRENARLYADTQNRLIQLTALQETTRAVASTLELDRLLNLIIEQAATLLQAEGGILNLVDWEKQEDEAVACTGSARDLTGARSRLRSSLSGWVTLHNEPVICNDVPGDSRVDRQALGWIASTTVQHAAVAPLTIRDQVVGTLAVLATQERARGFDEAELELLVAFANQAATAIENARLYEAEQRRADQFRAISEVGQRITSILDIDEVLVQIVRLIRDAFDYYHVGLGLVEGDVVAYKVGAGQLWDDPDFDFEPSILRVGQQGITGHVAATGTPLLVRDVDQDPRYVPMVGSATRSELAVPIKVKGNVIGVLDVQSHRVDAFEETDLSVLQSLAHQAAIAIENARLYEQAQEAAVVEERGRLARELHDAVTQTLFSASLLAEVLPATWDTDRAEGEQLLHELQQLSRGALAEMRALLLELRPTVLVAADLRDLLHQLAAAVTGRTGVPVRVSAHSADCLPDEVHIALYRIAQEALNNVVKHSNATDVTVDFACSGGDAPTKARLCVSDDGVGFDPASVAPEHLGLGIIRERADAIGATLQIDSAVGGGTRVVVTWHGQQDGAAAKEQAW